MNKKLRKTKIIATFGPALKNERVFEKVIKSGVNVIRFNFSHLTPDSAREQIKWVREQLKKIKHSVAFLGDLKGPEIRTDMDTYTLKTGEEFFFCHSEDKPDCIRNQSEKKLQVVGIDHPRLYSLVKKGMKVLADDGFFEFKIIAIEKKSIRLRVEQGGLLKTKKSVIIPGLDIGLPILNPVDKENLKVIVRENFGWIAASFVSTAQDVKEIRSFVHSCKGDIPIISKIESRKGIKNIDKILDASDGVMVARGDLGLEYPFEEVPILQEQIISKAEKKGVVTIIATQMLNSMIETPRPSRPEVSDISYAIRSRVDAVMLSGETASGNYPAEAAEAMNRIITTSESFYRDELLTKYEKENRLVPFCRAAIQLAFDVKAKCLIAISSQGKSARFLSAFRANLINIVATKDPVLYHRSFIYYSVFPILMAKELTDKRELFKDIIKQCKSAKYLQTGDKTIHIFTHETERISKPKTISTNSIREEIV